MTSIERWFTRVEMPGKCPADLGYCVLGFAFVVFSLNAAAPLEDL